MRAFTAFFHLANLSEENYRVEALHEREQGVSTDMDVDPGNELTVAYHQLVEEAGVARVPTELLNQAWSSTRSSPRIPPRHAAKPLKERFVASPALLSERSRLGGSDLVENERHLLQEIDALVRTSPIAHQKADACRRSRYHHRYL